MIRIDILSAGAGGTRVIQIGQGFFAIIEHWMMVTFMVLLNRNLTGNLSPDFGRLSYLRILDVMWNNISGTIPREIGNISTLELLLLNGNQLTGSLPDELGNLSNLDRIQIDQNHISGPIPISFSNLRKAKHFHMNNNSLSGQIPAELSRLPVLVHLLLDNNNLSGPLPPELSEAPNLWILQLDNNNLGGSIIPPSYGNMSALFKLSLRNCSLQGPIPDWSNNTRIAYIDLSLNQLNGTIPSGALSTNITTIDLTSNALSGTLPASFSSLPHLQKLDFEYNNFSNISGIPLTPPNVTLGLRGNPVCSASNLFQYCEPHDEDFGNHVNVTSLDNCPPQLCPPPYEYAPASPYARCFCAVPLFVGYRLKSPGFSDFVPYVDSFKEYISNGLRINTSQLQIDSVAWQRGPRLRMYLKIFPRYINDSVRTFNRSEVRWIGEMFGGWRIPENVVFGPYEYLNFTLVGPYREAKRISIRVEGMKNFSYREMALATNDFDCSTVVGQGGYGKVHRGVLDDGIVVAVKRAEEGSLQGDKEFLTELELLSRLHHRNLVSLIGYCDEEGEQGYLDPEYFLTHKLTDKSDVYSLGVVFLEMLTGMHPISHGKNIVREVNIAYRSGSIFSIIDERMGSYPSECVEKFINLALKCCQEETSSRPSMAEVVRELENIWLMMPESDPNLTESSSVTDSGSVTTPSSSSPLLKHPYISQDVSGSDLVSGAIPSIAPR
ncbi:probable LRR receptor-like serine/threonine-protein kinase at1g06840 [Phtheirospermum japonicum]|uniref:Probable LRR receptor-like serine/threonine-protein kinase at1g06840 n=1 Tax=Phtheirospermum japonicum TaxID=374723 RepID=A0A830B8V1_9LAMI|nr:probable LRR receptor-like serine/threonine-protein kinase at1g06840 [Phtheirospermum japonicum]